MRLNVSHIALASVLAGLAVAVIACKPKPPEAPNLDVAERSLTDLAEGLKLGKVSAKALVEAYRDRIETVDQSGAELKSVIALNPNALEEAKALDKLRKDGKPLGPLHGLPILVKDNIETKDPIATTAGSLALSENITGRDASVIARLRAAGAIILGKTNLSEWANIRSEASTSGWSAVGGLTRNPYALDRSVCGSSSGSGAAAAASLAAAAIGTETDGSITCPSAINGLVGIKPSVGLVSRTGIVPISHSQDTAGPMTRSVADAAALLTIMAGSDPADPATIEADKRKMDYTLALKTNALKGQRLGVLRFLTGYHAQTDHVFQKAVETLKAAGAEVVEIPIFPELSKLGALENLVLMTELKTDLNAYLAKAAPAVKARTLSAVIAFNKDHPEEMALFGQDTFLRAETTKGLNDPAYKKALAEARLLAGPQGIDKLLKTHKVSALIAPTTGPAWTLDPVTGDHYLGAASQLPAVSGYPHITVPMGQVMGLPVGLSFIGTKWDEANLIGLAYAYEQKAKARIAPTYPRTLDFGTALGRSHLTKPGQN